MESKLAMLSKLQKSLANPSLPESIKISVRENIKKLEKEVADEKALLDDAKKIEEAAEEVIEAAEKNEEEKAAQKEKAEKTEKKYPNRGKNTVQAKAKEIRKEGEDWKSALQRAQQLMKNDKQKATKKAEKTPAKKTSKETDKLLALVRTRKKLKKMVGYSKEKLSRDAARKALPPGRRVSKNGNVYYTNNPSKSDVYAPGYKGKVFLSKGGAITNERSHVNKAEKYETQYAKNKPHRLGYLDKRHFADGGSLGDEKIKRFPIIRKLNNEEDGYFSQRDSYVLATSFSEAKKEFAKKMHNESKLLNENYGIDEKALEKGIDTLESNKYKWELVDLDYIELKNSAQFEKYYKKYNYCTIYFNPDINKENFYYLHNDQSFYDIAESENLRHVLEGSGENREDALVTYDLKNDKNVEEILSLPF